ncbi:hypothetical protein E2562_026103 [Oryza meyeriana var. granulata]|uniref:Integrase catalytic domain-containing protein n=1 Tax=Oryza meyeriana var. granulata TaxID=110450 RepID=A0A6G1BYT5_9ORYZ|nr:hypothetical protein E2562_026103 [Oryza meyeriana var. granulata]
MACVTCQQYKADHLRPAGLLQPLPVPSAVWADIGIDFIEALPKVQGKTVILSVVDRFSKYCHFIPLAHPYTAESVAHAFFADIVRLHGVPQSIVSDRDPAPMPIIDAHKGALQVGLRGAQRPGFHLAVVLKQIVGLDHAHQELTGNEVAAVLVPQQRILPPGRIQSLAGAPCR